MKIRKISRLAFTFALVASVSFVSCSKKGAELSSGGLLESAMLAKVPPSSMFFSIMNMTSSAFSSFKASEWGYNPSELLEKADKLADQAGQGGKTFVNAIKATGFIRTSKDAEETISEMVLFGAFDDATKLPMAGAYFSAASGKELKSSVQRVSKSLKESGVPVKDDTISGNPAIEISTAPPGAAPGMPFGAIYFAASDSTAAISTNKAVIERAFSDAKDGLSKLSLSPEFGKVKSLLPSASQQLSVSYVAIKEIAAKASEFLPPMGEGAPDLKTIPVDAVLVSGRMSDTPSYLIAALTTAKTPSQDKIISNLGGGNAADPLVQAPAESSFVLGFDGALLAGIKAAALEKAPPTQQEMLKEQLKPLDGLKSLGIGVVGAAGASPFPGILISLNTANGEALEQAIKSNLSGAVASSGMPVSDWQDKTVEGTPVKYIQSPMVGLGVYMAKSGTGLVLGSSDDVIKLAILAAKAKSSALAASLSEDSQRLISETKSVLTAYGNFNRIADAIESVQGSLAAFTGGQNMVSADQTANLRKVGIMLSSVYFDSGILKIETTYSKAKTK